MDKFKGFIPRLLPGILEVGVFGSMRRRRFIEATFRHLQDKQLGNSISD